MPKCIYHWLASSYWGGILVGSILSPIFLALFLQGVVWMFRYLWPSRQRWSASLLNSPIPLEGGKAVNWRTDRPIQIGDSFVLDIRKSNGRGRIIDKIEFRRGNYSSAEQPRQVNVIIQNEHKILYDEKLDIERGYGIVVELKQPAKVTFIGITITAIYPNTYWAVGEMRLHEVRLFGRFWKVNIQ